MRGFTVAVYATAIFLSALLIFAVQPMFTKMVLPTLGGSPSVWSVAMVVFQASLFIGYFYAHLLTHGLKPWRAAIVHLVFLLVVAASLPLGIAKEFGMPPEHGVTLWLIGLFFGSIGLPFIALAASAPLLQNWFISTGHKEAGNPYVLYSISNLGSFAALLAYPTLIEPLFSLTTQISLWSIGFYALAALVAVAGYRNLDASRKEAEAVGPRPSATQCLLWVVLAAIPSALVIAITAFISTDLAAAPFLWVLPLALYLLTFVAVFRERPWVDHATVQRLVPYGVAPLAFGAMSADQVFWLVMIVINLMIFVVIALACHGEAYRTRPHRGRLTEYYLWISFGGALGGLTAGVIAPNIFNNIYEYPILLAVALLILPGIFEGGWQRFLRQAGPGLIAGTMLAIVGIAFYLRSRLGIEPLLVFALYFVVPVVLMLCVVRHLVRYFGLIVFALLVVGLWHPGERRIATVRSFFGVHQVVETADHMYHLLYHGTTVHGAMRVRDAAGNPVVGQPEPLAYYYFGGPLSDTIEASRGAQGTLSNVAVLGLGAGSLACHRHEGEQWTFFEIDPEVVRIAREPKLFRFLSACAPSAPIVLGDARLTLAGTPARYDLIILDVFSSDAIPVHLLTREAFGDYLSRLAPHGMIVAHVSNRHMELVSVVGAVGSPDGLVSYVKYDHTTQDVDRLHFGSIVVALARDRRDLGELPSRVGWNPVITRGVTAWTDDYSNLLGAIIRMKLGS
jgi:hypothetical protein